MDTMAGMAIDMLGEDHAISRMAHVLKVHTMSSEVKMALQLDELTKSNVLLTQQIDDVMMAKGLLSSSVTMPTRCLQGRAAEATELRRTLDAQQEALQSLLSRVTRLENRL